ncbi:MAG: aminotransferase class I/II-fold pyridoxal phosphate-dependent enzyme, partial [Planctomycetales bacterium]|nr:aminotransferase class I/II-fold pyridoxal phosphate-dependent enzyme [Planctomycetales bacterium]
MQETSVQQAQKRLASLYSSNAIGRAGNEWLGRVTEHFATLQQRSGPVLNWHEPQASVDDAASLLHDRVSHPDDLEDWIPRFRQLVEQILARGQNLHHPRYIGHQVPASIPIAAFFDALGAMTNQVMAIYEMGPWSTSVERAMIEQLGREIGYPNGSFAGLITNGGSLANLTALLTARNVAVENSWRDGIGDSSQLAFVVQNDVHYCVTRTAGILGIGTNQIVKIPVDDRRKMRVDLLDETLSQLRSSGKTVVAVAAGACSTPIGAFDPLNDIADVCERHGVWLHVDAAHGGGAMMSERHKHLVAGLNRADSVVWDAHKMLFMPALCAFAFYKNKAHRFVAFEQDAPYLFDPTNPGIAEYDSGTMTV